MDSDAASPGTGHPTDNADVTLLAERIVAGDRRALARSITLIESENAEHQLQADFLLKSVLSHTGNSVRIGITGVPGVGKSTFIEAFGYDAIERGHRIAVLAIDPSSPMTGGSILGDKTRMEKLSQRLEAFIRPSPSRGMLGGIARKTYETMLLCEAAGFDVIIIETVGVGQSETTVSRLVDFFMVLLAPGGGDDLQGIKRGIMELADMVVVNKADGDLLAAAERVRRDYAAALHIMRPRSDHWSVPVLCASAISGDGMAEIWDSVESYRETVDDTGNLVKKRGQQACGLMEAEITESLLQSYRQDEDLRREWHRAEDEVTRGIRSPGEAARRLLARYRVQN